MINKLEVKDLKSLKEAQARIKSDVLQHELILKREIVDLKENTLSFNGLLNLKSKKISNVISSFLIKKVLKPKSGLVKKGAIYIGSLLIEKYSGTLQKTISKLVRKVEQNPDQISS